MGIGLTGQRPDSTSNVPESGHGPRVRLLPEHDRRCLPRDRRDQSDGIGVGLPGALCFDQQEPSGCSPWNRYAGNGFGLTYGALRRPRTQASVSASISVARGAPTQFKWVLGGAVKSLLGDRLALITGLSFERSFDPPPNGLNNPLLASLMVDANLQLTRQLLVFATVIPWGSVGDVGQGVALRMQGGLSFAFTHHVEVLAIAGAYDLLTPRPWNHSVKESFATLELLLLAFLNHPTFCDNCGRGGAMT